MLLEAAVMYDRRVAALLGESDSSFSDRTLDTYPPSRTASPFPRLLIVVTGILHCPPFVRQLKMD